MLKIIIYLQVNSKCRKSRMQHELFHVACILKCVLVSVQLNCFIVDLQIFLREASKFVTGPYFLGS